ncbi:MAG: glycoside hydrolase family 18 [Mediterranea sp.]|jgi:hypothetical protein|nr:glycoside hydrolase family 18 [Mediterranea sp.]
MKHRYSIFGLGTLAVALLASLCATLGACGDWTDTETVDYTPQTPGQQNPELFARYARAVRDYKQRTHYEVYVGFDNGRDGSRGEKDFIRSLPDSVDAVVLERADALTDADRSDIVSARQLFATRFLYKLDLTAIKKAADDAGQEWSAALTPALEKMIGLIDEERLDGAYLSYTGDLDLEGSDTSIGTARQLLLDKLNPLAQAAKTLLFEGNARFIPQGSRDLFALYVLNTTSIGNTDQLRIKIAEARQVEGVSAERLFIMADPELSVKDEDNLQAAQVPYLSQQVIDSGPVGGILVRNAVADYAHPADTYQEIRQAIQTLNPSPLK